MHMDNRHISGWGATSKELREALHVKVFYIFESGKFFRILTEEEGDAYIAEAIKGTLRHRVYTAWFISFMRKCTFDNDNDFWVLTTLDKTPNNDTEQGFYRLGPPLNEFEYLTQTQPDTGNHSRSRNDPRSIAPRVVTLTYGSQPNPFYEGDAVKESEEIDMNSATRGNLLLTSRGLNTSQGTALIAQELQGENLSTKSILLVLLDERPPHCIRSVVRKACENMGFRRDNIFESNDLALPETVDYIYVTEGNTFELLRHLRWPKSTPKSKALIPYIRRNVAQGTTYIGASAGAMLAGVDVKLALEFDENYCEVTDFTALGLFQGTVIPHYTGAELARFIANSTEEELAGYDRIYHVDDKAVLCL